jgi:hypothetical protein
MMSAEYEMEGCSSQLLPLTCTTSVNRNMRSDSTDELVYYYQELLSEAQEKIVTQKQIIDAQTAEIFELRRYIEGTRLSSSNRPPTTSKPLNIDDTSPNSDHLPEKELDAAFYHSMFGAGKRGLVERSRSPRSGDVLKLVNPDTSLSNDSGEVAPPPVGPSTPSLSQAAASSAAMQAAVARSKMFDFSPIAKSMSNVSSSGCTQKHPDTVEQKGAAFNGDENGFTPRYTGDICRTDSESSTSFSIASTASTPTARATHHKFVISTVGAAKLSTASGLKSIEPAARSVTPRSVAARRQSVTKLRVSTADKLVDSAPSTAGSFFSCEENIALTESRQVSGDNCGIGFELGAPLDDVDFTVVEVRRPPPLTITDSGKDILFNTKEMGVFPATVIPQYGGASSLFVAHDNPQLGVSVADCCKKENVDILLEGKEDRTNETMFLIGKCSYSGSFDKLSHHSAMRGSQCLILTDLAAVKGSISTFPIKLKDGASASDSECIKELLLNFRDPAGYAKLEGKTPCVVDVSTPQLLTKFLSNCSSRVDVILKPITGRSSWYPYYEGSRKMAPQFRSSAVGYLRLGNDMSMFGTSFLSADGGHSYIGNDDSCTQQHDEPRAISGKAASMRAARLAKKLGSSKAAC